MSAEEVIDLGDRVILAHAHGRSAASLGTVIDRDPYGDRDTLVQVLYEDGQRRWRQRGALRRLGNRQDAGTLAADLRDLLGDGAPAWVKAVTSSE